MSIFAELKRRNVFRVGIAYAVAAWLLVQIADVLIDNIGAPDWVFRTLLMALAIGFPLALIFAWAFELTPDGVKRDKDVDRSTSIARNTGRKLDRTIIIVLALAVGYLLVDKLILQGTVTPPTQSAQQALEPDAAAVSDASIAVLPFSNMSNDPDNEYFSDGLTDTLLHMLAQIPDLRVAARTSSFSFKGQNRPIPEIARELGVANVLEGSVQRAGDQVRVTAQLIRATDGFHIWSQNYTRPLQDIFAIQDEIATDVAGALGASLLGEGAVTVQGVNTRDLTAYDRYLKGLEQQALFTYGGLDAAENHFEQALTRDASFTDARLALVRNYLLKNATGMITLPELHQTAQPVLQQVLEIDPGNKLAQAYGFIINIRFRQDFGSMDEIRETIYKSRDLLAFIPTDTFLRTNVASGLHFWLEESEAALDVLAAGVLIDPLDAEIHIERGRILADLGRPDEAELAFLRAIELSPDSPTAYLSLGVLESRRGDFPAFLDRMHQGMLLDPKDHEIPFIIADSLYALDLAEAAEPYFLKVQALAPGSAMARLLELIRARERGEDDRAREMARSMIADQVDNRHGSFLLANLFFADSMMRAGREKEAYDYLVEVRPDVELWREPSSDFRVDIMRTFAIALMSGFATFEERQSVWARYMSMVEASGFPIPEGSGLDVMDAIINGEVDRAVTTEIDFGLAKPVSEAPWRHDQTMDKFYEPLHSDPRYMAALDERRREVALAREQVQELLLTPEWSE